MQKLKLIILYVLLVSGGLWHILGVFGSVMTLLASPLIIGLGVWLFFENWYLIPSRTGPKKTARVQLLLWSLFVIICSIFIESLGVKTGFIFGAYQYGNNLPPYIGSVPIAIGFAWLAMLFSSISIVQKLVPKSWYKLDIVFILGTTLFMTLFDIFMEPAATKLQYWTWENGQIPLKNYFAWFIISYIFAWIGVQFKVLTKNISTLGMHAYIAQFIYFILIYFS
jgi:uncharacterized membrane protein